MVLNAMQARRDSTGSQLKCNDSKKMSSLLTLTNLSLRSCFASSLSEFFCLFYCPSLGHGQSFTCLSEVSKDITSGFLRSADASLECWQCVQTRPGVCPEGSGCLVTEKSQSFLVMASPTDQMEKKETEGWKKRGHWVPPYFMPAQIWPRLGNFLVAKSF